MATKDYRANPPPIPNTNPLMVVAGGTTPGFSWVTSLGQGIASGNLPAKSQANMPEAVMNPYYKVILLPARPT